MGANIASGLRVKVTKALGPFKKKKHQHVMSDTGVDSRIQGTNITSISVQLNVSDLA